MGKRLLWFPVSTFEPETTRFVIATMRQPARTQRLVLDVGANTGFFSLLVLATDPHARIAAFEPTPRIHTALVENLSLNGFESRAQTFQAGLSEQPGTGRFYVPENDHTAASLTMSHATNYAFGSLVKEHEISLVRFDDLTLQLPVFGCKIDVEGHELQALRGMTRMLARDKPWLVVETLTASHLLEVEGFLQSFGYQTAPLDPTGRGQGPRNTLFLHSSKRLETLNSGSS
jgi:FkbM family methyltransferase